MHVDGAPVSADARELARVLWTYLCLATDPLPVSDLILVLGSHDLRVAAHAAELFLDGKAPLVVISGGRGKVTANWQETEAETFARIVREMGVPEYAVLLEQTATNTGANITASRALLATRDITVDSAIVVAKPYMARRGWATAREQWPGVRWSVSSQQVSYDDYCLGSRLAEAETLNLMVGDLQRMRVFAERGFQVPQDVPDHVWAAYERLVALGYRRHVLE